MSDNTAQFNFYLNRQGVTGKQGAKGEKGFSPVISVEKDTLSEYILRITNESSYFLTTNLRESKEDRGGTYIRYDRDQGIMYAGDADRANKTQYGEVKFATPEELAAGDENTVITPADLEDATTNMVTTDTTQDISGIKTFTTQVEVQPSLVIRPMGGSSASLARTQLGASTSADAAYIAFYNSENQPAKIGVYDNTSMYIQAPFESDKLIINNYGGESVPTGNAKDVIIYGNLINKNNNVESQVLNQDNVTAGENITIDKTSNGITINSTGGETYVLPQANATTLGGIKANPTTDEDTQPVNIDPTTGLLYTKAGGGGTIEYIDGGNAQTDEPAVLKASNVDLGIYPTNNIYSTNENITIE